MPSSLTSLHYHLVFSTRERRPLIRPEVQNRLWDYLGGTINGMGGKSLKIGGIEDHVHILAGIPPTTAVSNFLRELKKSSSTWMKDHSRHFQWQVGYGAFTVSRSQIEVVAAYIEAQPEHHRSLDSREELRKILEAHGVEFDSRFFA